MKNELSSLPPLTRTRQTFGELSGMPLQNESIEFKLARRGLRASRVGIF